MPSKPSRFGHTIKPCAACRRRRQSLHHVVAKAARYESDTERLTWLLRHARGGLLIVESVYGPTALNTRREIDHHMCAERGDR